ncbi:hypothetical protein SAMN04244571_04749 [Azotobacter beijerinckii]|uniref:TIR domain-containing protein n=2 Tax=Azotobacter beijerinckii TaxID=170623 RepID=A0A1I1CQK1_9GAMM|nr:hypothetical protein SAMN04244571_04749 [Azotobacter beijerinckii]
MLEDADVVIAIVGSLTIERSNQMMEIRQALDLGKRLIPVFVDRLAGPPELLDRWCANIDAARQILYLAEQEGSQRDFAIALTAANIRNALALPADAGEDGGHDGDFRKGS